MGEAAVSELKSKKSPKRGIIYLSFIPPYTTVSKIREIFSQFGTLGRVYLQLGESTEKKRSKFKKHYTEGWIEFERKSVAKKVATFLNNTPVSTQKKSKQYDYLWNIKYLSNFKWIHLHERLAYEKAAKRQKLRAEITLAKKKTNFFSANLNKKNKTTNKEFQNVKQPETVEEKEVERVEFLESLFN